MSSDLLTFKNLLDGLTKAMDSDEGCLTKLSICELDRVEAQLQTALAKVREVRNCKASPFSNFPPEVLNNIFTMAHASTIPPIFFSPYLGPARPYDEPSPPGQRTRQTVHSRPRPAWFHLREVCRKWKAVIDADSSLWSTIDGHFMPELFLERSQMAPLTIYLREGLSDFGKVDRALLEKIKHALVETEGKDQAVSPSDRLTHFHIDVCPNYWTDEKTCDMILDFPARNLVSLSIWRGSYRMEPDDDNTVDFRKIDTVPLFFDPLGKGLLGLKQLSLSHYTLWPSGYFRGLTHIVLFGQPMARRVTLSSFLDFLEFSPQLEELALVDAGPTGYEDDGSPANFNRFVSLPHLRELSIGDWPSSSVVSRFLSHLALPAKSNMYIWGRSVHEDLMSSFLPEDCCRLENLQTIRHWSLRCDAQRAAPFHFSVVDSTLHTAGSFTLFAVLDIAQHVPMHFVQSLNFMYPERPYTLDYSNYRSPFGPSMLDLNSDESSTWRGVFSCLPALQHMRIQSTVQSYIWDMITALYQVTAQTRQRTRKAEYHVESLILPHLESLCIEGSADIPFFHICILAAEYAKVGTQLKRLLVKNHTMRPPKSISDRYRSLSYTPDNSEDGRSDDDDISNEDGMRDEDGRSDEHDPQSVPASHVQVACVLKQHIADVVIINLPTEEDWPMFLYNRPPKWHNRVLEWTRRHSSGP